MRKKSLVVALMGLAAAGLTLLSGCGGSSGGVGLRDPELFFVNAIPDSPAVVFTLNDEVRGGPFDYLGASTQFISVPFLRAEDDAYDAAVGLPDGSDVFDSEARLFEFETSSIIIAIGQRSTRIGEEDKRVQLKFLDVPRDIPVGNRARLLIVHAFNRAPGAQTPSVIFQSPGDNPQYRTSDIAYGSTADITVDSGVQDFVVKRSDGDAIYASVRATLDPGTNYLTVVSGIEGDVIDGRRPRVTFIKVPPRR